MKTPAVLNRLPSKKPASQGAVAPERRVPSLESGAASRVEARVEPTAETKADGGAVVNEIERSRKARPKPKKNRPRATVRQKARELTQTRPKVHVTTIRVTPFTRDSLEGALETRKQRFDFSVRNKSEVVRLALQWFFETCRGDVDELEHFGDEDVRTESISVRLEEPIWRCYQQIPEGSRGALCNAIVATYVKRHLQKVKMTFDLRGLV